MTFAFFVTKKAIDTLRVLGIFNEQCFPFWNALYLLYIYFVIYFFTLTLSLSK